MTNTWWMGRGTSKTITADAWALMGESVAADTIWNADNGWSVDESTLTSGQLAILSKEKDFKTGQTGPRQMPSPADAGTAQPRDWSQSAYKYYLQIKTWYEYLVANGTTPGEPVVDWTNVTGKPTSFPPSAHTHGIGDVTSLQDALDAKATAASVTALAASIANAVTLTGNQTISGIKTLSSDLNTKNINVSNVSGQPVKVNLTNADANAGSGQAWRLNVATDGTLSMIDTTNAKTIMTAAINAANNAIMVQATKIQLGIALDMGGLAIQNLLNPVNDQDAATKKWVVDNFGVSSVAWTAITGKPSAFTPDYAGNPVAEANLATALAAKINGKVDSSLVGAANGIVPLGSDTKIASIYLPSYVDDVLDFANTAAFPGTGEAGKIYVADDTNKTYRWNAGTSAYIEISASPGSTDAVAEGISNLYFTNSRADGRISAALSSNTIMAYSSVLAGWAALTTAANKMMYFTGTGGAAATTDLSPFARTLIDDADAATARGTLGLGAAATKAGTVDIPVWYEIHSTYSARLASSYGDNTLGFTAPAAFTLTEVVYKGETADAGGTTTAEIRKNGAQISGTSLGVAAASQWAYGSAVRVTGLNVAIAAGDILRPYISAVGTTPGKGFAAIIIGKITVTAS